MAENVNLANYELFRRKNLIAKIEIRPFPRKNAVARVGGGLLALINCRPDGVQPRRLLVRCASGDHEKKQSSKQQFLQSSLSYLDLVKVITQSGQVNRLYISWKPLDLNFPQQLE